MDSYLITLAIAAPAVLFAILFVVGKAVSFARGVPVRAKIAELVGCASPDDGELRGQYRGVATSVKLATRFLEEKNLLIVTMVMPDLPVRWRVRTHISFNTNNIEKFGRPWLRDETMEPAEVIAPVFTGMRDILITAGMSRLEVGPRSLVMAVVALGVRPEDALSMAAEVRGKLVQAFADAEAALPVERDGAVFREGPTDRVRDEARKRWRALAERR